MAKRGHGEGTIYEDRLRGLWICERSYVDLETGKTKRKKFAAKSRKLAVAKGKEFIQEIDNGLLSEACKVTVGVWITRWLNDYVKIRVRPRTWEKYKSCLENYIFPRFKDVLLKDLRAPDVQRHFNKLLVRGRRDGNKLSSSTVRGTRRYFTMCIDGAIKAGLLTHNIVKQTESPKLVKKEIVVLEPEQAGKLIDQAKIIKNPFMRKVMPMVLQLALHTGMRQGEIFGLKWQDIDLNVGCIYVKRSLAYVSGRGFILQDPKTKSSRRKIPVMQDDVAALLQYQAWQDSYKDELGDKYLSQELVFSNMFGGPLDTGNFVSRYFKPLLKEAGIKDGFTFHDLRHTHATILLREGVNPKIVQERLGHSTVTLTLDLYSHVLPDMQGVAVEALEKAFAKEKEDVQPTSSRKENKSNKSTEF
ncbi:MAG: site-specific integrase [Smithella sp.]